MTRRAATILLLLGLVGCGGLEDSIRDVNRSLYRTWAGDDRPARPGSGSSGELTPCFSSDSGLLYLSQTGRCAPGYAAIPIEQAASQFGSTSGSRTTGRSAPEPTPLPQQTYAPATSAPAASSTASAQPQGQALCYDDRQGQVFGATSCPAGSRWVTAAEAEALQQAQLAGASWCFFANRRVLYRSRTCRPGDQTLDVAQADKLWETLPPDRRPRLRPAETTGGVQPVPPVQASPRGGVSATPLPAPR